MHRSEEKVAYLVALPAILLGIGLKVIPLFTALKLPFIDYNPVLGLGGSPYIGFQNFSNLFSTYYYRRLVSNTLILKFGYIFISGIISFILGLSLSSIRQRGLRKTFIVLFLVPFFIPTSVFSFILLRTVSVRWFIEPDKFRISYIIIEALKKSGVFALVVLSLMDRNKQYESSKASRAAQIISILLLVQLSSLMTIDFEVLNEFLNPLVYNVADTLDTYIYRTGLISGEINQVSPMWFLRFIIQISLTVGIYYTIKSIYIEGRIEEEYGNNPREKSEPERGRSNIIGIVTCIIYVIVLLMPLIYLFGFKGEIITDGSQKFKTMELIPMFIKYLSITVLAVGVNMLMTILLSYPLTASESRGQKIYEIFLLILLVAGQSGVHNLIFYQSFGVMGTVYPYILNSIFPIMNVIILAGIYSSEYSFSGIGTYIARQYRHAIAFGGLQFIAMWNSNYQDIYMNNEKLYSPIAMFKSMVSSSSGEFTRSLLVLGLWVSIPSLLVGLIVAIFADKRVFISRMRD